MREVDDAHPADAEHSIDAILAELLTDQRIGIFGQQLRRRLERRRGDEVPRFIVITQQRFDLLAQRVVARAALLDESASRSLGARSSAA